ncbi:MAG: acetate uptake transporter [Phycisphaerae bacterium]
MPDGETVTQVKDTTANPAPLGLMGFGMTTVLLNMHNAGWFNLGTMILGMGIFYGGLCQIIAGVLEWKKGNTFATTAFASYGAFWLSFVALLALGEAGLGVWQSASTGAVIAYLIMWGIFTFVMFIATLRLNRALQVIFGTLFVLFFLLAAGDATGNAGLKTFTAYEGIFCGASAIYLALAEVLNEVYGRTILPIGPMKK